MKRTIILFFIALCFNTLSSWAQSENIIRFPDVTAMAGKYVDVPVYVENTVDITGLQFCLQVPEEVYFGTMNMDRDRITDHSCNMTRAEEGRWFFMVYSPTNAPITGRKGALFTLEMYISETLPEGTVIKPVITNAILTTNDATNVLDDVVVGNITVGTSPDLIIPEITIAQETANPNGIIDVSWTVKNIGSAGTEDGWSESVSLIDDRGYSHYLGSFYYDNLLDAEATVSRNVSIQLPWEIGMDGDVNVRIQLFPYSNCGERAESQANNTTTSTDSFVLNKALYLRIYPNETTEGDWSHVTAYVNRSARWDNEVTFDISAEGDSRVHVPANVTFWGNNGSFDIEIDDNEDFDPKNAQAIITIHGKDGYNTVTDTLTIYDDELGMLTLTPSREVVDEGETITLTVDADHAPAEDVRLQLRLSETGKFEAPASFTLPAGSYRTSVEVTAINDDLPGLPTDVEFTVSGEGYRDATALVLVEDDDLPVIDLTLTPQTISEGDGPTAIIAKLQRLTNIDKKVTILFSDDSENGDINYNQFQTITLERGQKECTFNIGPYDNLQVDGDRDVTITAAVYISSCSCSAAGQSAGAVSKTIRILDNDGPALKLTSSRSVILEGGAEGTTLTVSRNTETSQPLSVYIQSDYDSQLSYNHTVTIPAGETSATVEVKALANSTSGDSYNVTFTATASGYATGTCWAMVSDQTLPDAAISSLRIIESESDQVVTEAEVGTRVRVTLEVTNGGAAVLPSQTRIQLYERGEATMLLYTDEDLAPGAKTTVTRLFNLSSAVGDCDFYAVINEKHQVPELLYANNTSEHAVVTILSPFTVKAVVEKGVYNIGETITISGEVKGEESARQPVDVYIINDGYRHVITAESDDQGRFTTTYKPFDNQLGHFIVGACYPGDTLEEAQSTFEIVGLKRVDMKYITNDILLGEPHTGTVALVNPSQLPLTGITARLSEEVGDFDVQFNIPATIQAGETIDLQYTLTGKTISEGKDWKKTSIVLSSAEGTLATIPLYYYIRSLQGNLVASVEKINSTVPKDGTHDYVIDLVNTGKGTTGAISLALPDWIKSLTPKNISPLAQGDTAQVILRFAYNKTMQLNVPIKGTIGVNCENCNGLTIPYSVMPVSESKGTLIVDACDEYTYYTEEAPHVQGATVSVQNPATGVPVAEGQTGEDGTFTVELPEGYYTLIVSEPHHDYYKSTIIVDPGMTTTVTADLPYQAVSIGWSVEEFGMEDEYVIKVTTKYETEVPVPVVICEGPEYVDGDALAVGQSVMLYYTLTNHGLINALDVTYSAPETNGEFTLTQLAYTEPFTLAPSESVTIPVLFKRISAGTEASSQKAAAPKKENAATVFTQCMASMAYKYGHYCHGVLSSNPGAQNLAFRACMAGSLWSMLTMGGIGAGNPGIGTPGNGVSGGGGDGGSGGGFVPSFTICDPDDAGCGNGVAGALASAGGPAGDLFNGLGDVGDMCNNMLAPARKGAAPKKISSTAAAKGILAGGEAIEKGKGAKDLWDACKATLKKLSNQIYKRKVAASYDANWKESQLNKIQMILDQVEDFRKVCQEISADSVWYTEMDEEKRDFINIVALADPQLLNPSDLLPYKPSSVSNKQMEAYVERMRNSALDIEADNAIDMQHIKEIYLQMKARHDKAVEMGHDGLDGMWADLLNDYVRCYSEASAHVCSSVTLQIKQTVTMTRQAFRGTLEVVNAHEFTAMENVVLTLDVKNMETGALVTSHEFQINAETLKGFGGDCELGAPWTLEAGATGTATIVFIPTKYAAPTENAQYSFAGKLTYLDPYTGYLVTRELAPVSMTVKPCPELDLTYFVQRDIIGDDPLTEEKEDCEEAEFALLINNKGYGDATDLRIVTEQPEILDNEKGLAIDFEIISAQLNGEDKTLALGGSIASDFGTVASHQTAYGQWWLEASLLGHFTEYEVEYTHVTSYGNEDLSLLDNVTVHELIRGIDVSAADRNSVAATDKLRGWLVNDVADYDDLPETIYFSDGTTESLGIMSDAYITKEDENTYRLTLRNTGDAGWYYGSVTDPTYGQQTLTSIVRESDGAEMALGNFWQTDRTLRDGKDPLYENRIHFADNIVKGDAVYILSFTDRPEVRLAVEGFEQIPETTEVLSQALDAVTVVFNKEIQAETFTTDDLTLTVQGIRQDLSAVAITTDDSKSFDIDLSAFNAQYVPTETATLYVLTVNTADILDASGFAGKKTATAMWTVQPSPIGIEQTTTPSAEESLFDLQGRRVLHSRHPGIYILNGRKKVVR